MFFFLFSPSNVKFDHFPAFCHIWLNNKLLCAQNSEAMWIKLLISWKKWPCSQPPDSHLVQFLLIARIFLCIWKQHISCTNCCSNVNKTNDCSLVCFCTLSEMYTSHKTQIYIYVTGLRICLITHFVTIRFHSLTVFPLRFEISKLLFSTLKWDNKLSSLGVVRQCSKKDLKNEKKNRIKNTVRNKILIKNICFSCYKHALHITFCLNMLLIRHLYMYFKGQV